MKYPGFESLMKYEEKDDSSKRIINAAIYEFAMHGFVQSTTKAIAKRAEVSEALVFKYFGNKQKLLGAVSLEIVEHRLPELFDAIMDAWNVVGDMYESGNLIKIIKEKFYYISGHIGYFKILLLDIGFNPEETVQTVKAMLNGVLEHLDVEVLKLQKRGIVRKELPPRAVIRGFVGTVHFLMFEKNLLNPTIDIDKALETHIEIFLKGVGIDD